MKSMISNSLPLAILLLAAACGGGTPQTNTTAQNTDPTAPRTGAGDAVSAQAQNQWADAIRAYQTVETASNGAAWTSVQCDDIVSKFEQAVQSQGGRFPEAIYMQGVVRQRCGQNEQAAALFQRALSQNDRFCRAQVALGLEFQRTNRPQQAAEAFATAIQKDPRCTEGYVNTAMVQRRNGNHNEALDNLRRALAIESQYLPAFNEMALLYYEQAARDAQKLDLASIVCDQAVGINASYAPIHNTIGLIRLRQNRLLDALRAFQRSAELDPRNFEAWMNFGQMTLGFRGYQDAQNAFTKALELNPRDYDATIGLGVALRGLRQTAEAKAKYEAAQALDPSRPEAYFNLGVLANDYMGGAEPDLTRAKEYFTQFVQRAGNNERYAQALQDVNRRCGLDRQAERRRRRGQARTCKPGRLELIDFTISQLREMQQIAAQAAALQAQADQQAAQQPAPAPTPEPAPTPAPAPTP